jgi:hypothetical protein
MKHYFIAAFAGVLFTTACGNPTPKKETQAAATEAEEWVNLIDQNSLDGWHYFQDDASKKGWSIEEGVLTFDSSKAEGEGDKSLLTDGQYKNFEIYFEWKVSSQSNSGFMWGVNEEEQYEFPYETGPEIQLLDPEVYKGDEANQIHTAGALYDLQAPSSLVTKPAGEWNSYSITIDQDNNLGVVIHNDVEINRFPLRGEVWDAMVANSKFASWEGYGKYPTGHLCIQDHPGVISYRNMKIREF